MTSRLNVAIFLGQNLLQVVLSNEQNYICSFLSPVPVQIDWVNYEKVFREGSVYASYPLDFNYKDLIYTFYVTFLQKLSLPSQNALSNCSYSSLNHLVYQMVNDG